MNCPKCHYEQQNTNAECPHCGIIFDKFYEHARPQTQLAPQVKDKTDGSENGNFLINTFLYVSPDAGPGQLIGRAVVLTVLLVWGVKLMLHTNAAADSILHMVNLPFHEAGHIFFRPFGRLCTSMGGSLGQLLMPLICLLVLSLKTRDNFGAAVCLWWFGVNYLDLAPYIADARSLSLPLLGGNSGSTSPYGFHDWEFILTELGMLQYDHLLAGLAYKIGILLMLISYAWGAYLLLKHFRNF